MTAAIDFSFIPHLSSLIPSKILLHLVPFFVLVVQFPVHTVWVYGYVTRAHG
jgi:hypothetical protein